MRIDATAVTYLTLPPVEVPRALHRIGEHDLPKGLPTNAACVAIGRRILRVAFSVFKAQPTYDPAMLPAA